MASQMSSQVRSVQPRQRSVYPQKSITRRHKKVILMVVNSGYKRERKVNKEGESDSSRFLATC